MGLQPELPLVIDSTQISTFRSCGQKFYEEFCLGLRPSAVSIDLHAGACTSSALERFYRAVHKEKVETDIALARAYGTFHEEWGQFEILKDTAKTKENMWAAVESYISMYPPKTDLVQPFNVENRPTVEFSFAIPLDMPGFPMHPTGVPFIYGGRFDMLGMWNGRVVVRDEKTAGRLESNWSEKWDLRSQFMGYCWALQTNGIDCDTCIVRGIIITKKEIRHVEAIKQYPKFLISRWYTQLQRDLTRIVESWNTQTWDYNLADSCTAYSHCPFMPRCTSPEPSRWDNNYVVRRWNPLDRNPVAENVSSPLSAANAASIGTQAEALTEESRRLATTISEEPSAQQP